MALLAPSLRGASFLLQDTDVADHCSFFFWSRGPLSSTLYFLLLIFVLRIHHHRYCQTYDYQSYYH